jgi:hypothetical protein
MADSSGGSEQFAPLSSPTNFQPSTLQSSRDQARQPVSTAVTNVEDSPLEDTHWFRQRPSMTYTEDSDSATPDASNSAGVSDFAPEDEETQVEDFELLEDFEPEPIQPTTSRAGRPLRPRVPVLHILKRKAQYNLKKVTSSKPVLTPDALSTTPPTARGRIRKEIAEHTLVKQKNFLLHHKDFFLPLLSDNNYINDLEKLRQDGSLSGVQVPHREIEAQPRG